MILAIIPGLINSQQQPQKPRMMGMFENLVRYSSCFKWKPANKFLSNKICILFLFLFLQPPNTQSQQSRFTQNSIVDDDLGKTWLISLFQSL